jgi:glycerate 2-kinase
VTAPAPKGPRIRLIPPVGPSPHDRGNEGLRAVVEALEEGLMAADPAAIIRRAVSVRGDTLSVGSSVRLDLSNFERVVVIGGGKASGKMAFQLESMLGRRITSGLVNVPEGAPLPGPTGIRLHGAGHPLPSREGERGVRMMLNIIGRPSRRDLVICLISGGGSSLMASPAAGISLRDLQVTTRLLLRSGADIVEMNAVRKHVSAVAGGRLAEKLFPASVLSLIISDVVGDDIDVVASGPTAPDSSTYLDAMGVLQRYSLWDHIPSSVEARISAGVEGSATETPKSDSEVFRAVRNVVVGGNMASCSAVARKLKERGYTTMVLSTRIRGEAKEIGRVFGDLARGMVEQDTPLRPPACIVAGGETTVTVSGGGSGGRNQELVLAAALAMEHTSRCCVASIGSDGIDGTTQAAGALATSSVVREARARGLEPERFLREHDSNAFFRKMGGLLFTGHTGTNVNDIMVAIGEGELQEKRTRKLPGMLKNRSVHALDDD